uniref:Uncharacterized protein LOC116939466 isoform X2 n=1 Tax=Petromyzon marinus TaxID=7757 RepID=A0AAJ7WNA4_PETMA|nr:uncharacterized protein LOC116939466 isoform X2 [Petromyzon marinus]
MESIPQLGGLWNRNSILLGSTIAHPVVTVPISTPPAAAASPTTTTHEQRRHQLQQHYHQPHAHNHQPPPRPTSPMTTTNMMSTISINGEVVVGGGGDDGRSGGTTTATTATLNVARSSNHDSQQLLVALLLGCHQLLHLLRQRRRRRRLLLHLQHLRMCRSLFARARAALRPRRRFWMAPQSQQWWECVVQERFADADWLREFRMRRATFERLCSLVAADVAPAAAAAFVRKPVDTRKRVAIALFKLATGAEYRVVGELFGVSKTTVHRYLYRVCRCVCHLLLRHSVHLPALEEARAISERFCKQHVLPQVFGCIGSTHIPVLAPRLGSRDYANRNQWPSIILQTIVDDTLRKHSPRYSIPHVRFV